MEELAEFVLTLIYEPFKFKYLDLRCKIENIHNRALKVFLKIILVLFYFLIPLVIVCLTLGVVCLIIYFAKK